ncbi:DUF2490 domain-containing protein [Wenyingzhuangia sp. IMCC45533]
MFIFSQQVVVTEDFGAWIGANFEKEVLKDFDLSINPQIRLQTNASEVDSYLLNLGGKYKINKHFKLGAAVRYTHNRRRVKAAEDNFRYNLDLGFAGKIIKKLKFSYRLRYQHEYLDFFKDLNANHVNFFEIRNKIRLKYKLNKNNSPYFSSEIFKLNETFKESTFNKIRFYIGDQVNSGFGDFDIALGYEKELNAKNPLTFLFVKLIYNVEL